MKEAIFLYLAPLAVSLATMFIIVNISNDISDLEEDIARIEVLCEKIRYNLVEFNKYHFN